MPAVLLISYSGSYGGAERVLLDWAEGLEADLWLACPAGPLADAALGRGVRVVPSRSGPLELRGGAATALRAALGLLRHGVAARGLARSLDPDLIVASGMRSGLAVLLGPGRRLGPDRRLGPNRRLGPGRRLGRDRRRAPVVLQHHDLLPGPTLGRWVRVAARRADLVIVPSQFVADDLGEPAVVVAPGVSIERFASVPAAARERDAPVVLVLGALVEWKRPRLALEVFALACRRHRDLRLRFVGAPLGADTTSLLALKTRAAALGVADAVEFAGSADDVAAEFSRAALLLHCADREPFGIAVAEALAAGRPAVVPAAGGVREIVDGTCAVMYAPGDANAAAEAVSQIVEDAAFGARLGAAGRERARQRFDRTVSVSAYARAVGPLLPAAAPRTTTPLALVTVTHNSEAELGTFLASARRHLPDAQVIVVDSASRDGSVALARSSPNVTVIALEANVGFGAASNAGLEAVDAPVTAFVNPDVEFVDGSLLTLAEEAARTDRTERLFAPLVLFPDGRRQDSVHPVPGSAADLVFSVVSPAALPGRLGAALAPWRAGHPRRVGWAIGCALLARTATFRRLGPFDASIFMYGEDLDLGLRAAEAGVPTWFWPAARIVHHGAHASARAFGGEPFDRLARGRHDVVTRRLGPARARWDDRAQALTFLTRIAARRVLGRAAERERRQLSAVRGLVRG